MAYKSIFDEIVFIEGDFKEAKAISEVQYRYGSIGAQLKNLNDVKRKLASDAKIVGANCITKFEYGQKSSWISLDDTKWYGSGIASKLEAKEYNDLIKEIANR